MTFEECCVACLQNKDLVNEFNKLTGSSLYKQRNGIDMMVDNAGADELHKEHMKKFVPFVYEYIWLPLVNTKTA